MTTLHDRLSALADVAGSRPDSLGTDLWVLGRRQHRRRQAGAALVGAAVLVIVVGLGVILGLPPSTDRTTPADVPFGELHLPRTVYAPSAWAPGTDEAGPLGPLAAVGTATRSHPDGLSGQRDSAAAFGVSAVDGSVRWLDLPHARNDLGYGTLTLSPDGSKVGYTVPTEDGSIRGWAVYDSTTGKTVQLQDPSQSVIAGTDAFEIAFSGDSRYLQTNYSLVGSNRSRDDSLVIWDVETSEPTVVEGTGYYWLPNLGSAPEGIVWSRKQETFTFDPTSGRTTIHQTPQRIIEWSVGPGGASAYIAFGDKQKYPWRLFSGDGQELDAGLQTDDLVGWRDARTVVVMSLPDHAVRYVDVRTGKTVGSERLGVAEDDSDSVMMWPVLASGLWANEVVDGVEPPDVEDPRVSPLEVARVAGLGVALSVVGWLLWRRRVRP